MAKRSKPYTILMAEDDPDDCLLVEDALRETGHTHDLRIVRDGEELGDYLHRRGKYTNGKDAPRPDLILLDLKMPKRDGCEVIGQLKSDPQFKRIPVVALTTSMAADDIRVSYDMGVNSYVTKPVTFRGLVDMMDILSKYWFEMVELPPME